MRNKAPLALIEMLIMLAVFSLAAAWCLQAFAAADRISRESAARDRAVIEAQNAAELLQHYAGDHEKAAQVYGGSWDGECWQISYDEDWKMTGERGSYLLRAKPAEAPHPLMGMSQVTVTMDGETLFSIPAAWQEER